MKPRAFTSAIFKACSQRGAQRPEEQVQRACLAHTAHRLQVSTERIDLWINGI